MLCLQRNDGLVYKRVYIPEDDTQNLLLSSDNKTYQPYLVSRADILELWEFYLLHQYPRV